MPDYTVRSRVENQPELTWTGHAADKADAVSEFINEMMSAGRQLGPTITVAEVTEYETAALLENLHVEMSDDDLK
jgi:NRPS condensation-like uncharacterized protein